MSWCAPKQRRRSRRLRKLIDAYAPTTRRFVSSHAQNCDSLRGRRNSPAFWSRYTVVVLTRSIRATSSAVILTDRNRSGGRA